MLESLFKLQGCRPVALLKRDSNAGVFPVNIPVHQWLFLDTQDIN